MSRPHARILGEDFTGDARDRGGRIGPHRRSGYAEAMKRPVPSTTPTAEEPALLSDEDRAERLRLLAERVFDPDGLDRETLARIEQLTDQPR